MDATLPDTRSALERGAQTDADTLSPTCLRAWLVVGCALFAAIAVSYGSPSAYLDADPELALLLRGMSVIKAGMAIGAAGLLWWRFGHPIGRGWAVGYLLGAWLTAVASGLIWQLTLIVPAALVFHVGGFALLVVAYLDRDAVRLTTPSSRVRP